MIPAVDAVLSPGKNVRNPWGPSPGLDNLIPLLSNYTSWPGALAGGLAWPLHTPPWCPAALGFCGQREDPQETQGRGGERGWGAGWTPTPPGPAQASAGPSLLLMGLRGGTEPPFLGTGTVAPGGAEPAGGTLCPSVSHLGEAEGRCGGPWGSLLRPQPSRAHVSLSRPGAPFSTADPVGPPRTRRALPGPKPASPAAPPAPPIHSRGPG